MPNKRKLILAGVAIALLAIIITVICIIPKERKMTELEKTSLTEFSTKVMNYMENIDNPENGTDAITTPLSDISYDRYIAYALEYSYGENDKASLTADEIKELIESLFDVQIEKDKIVSTGISPTLLDKKVSYDPSSETYSIVKTGFSKRDIAAIPIDVYLEKELKTDGDNYIGTYSKYNISNPHDALSFATGDDIKDATEYVNGKGKEKSIKKILTQDNAEKISTYKKDTIVKFGMKNGKMLVISIK